MFYRRKAYSNDRNPAWLGEAETELDRALKLGGDKASLGEANLWLGVTCLEMENADKRRKATEAIFQAVRQCDASWADVFLVQVFDEEIQLADRWWDQRPDRGSRESVHRFLDEVRKQCDAFMNRWPDRAMAVAAVKARAAAVEDKFEDAMTLCKDGLKLSPNKDSPKDLIVLLLTKVEVALDESNPLPIDHTDLALSVAQAAERAKKFQLGSGLEARIACWTAYAGYCRDLENKQVTQADWRSVRKSLEEAIEQSPSDAREIPVCRLATAVVCFRLGDYAEADAHARKVRDSKHVTMKQARQAHEVLEKVAPLLSKPKLK
jgi:tetratricopeptide (TPR) repeat protein